MLIPAEEIGDGIDDMLGQTLRVQVEGFCSTDELQFAVVSHDGKMRIVPLRRSGDLDTLEVADLAADGDILEDEHIKGCYKSFRPEDTKDNMEFEFVIGYFHRTRGIVTKKSQQPKPATPRPKKPPKPCKPKQSGRNGRKLIPKPAAAAKPKGSATSVPHGIGNTRGSTVQGLWNRQRDKERIES